MGACNSNSGFRHFLLSKETVNEAGTEGHDKSLLFYGQAEEVVTLGHQYAHYL